MAPELLFYDGGCGLCHNTVRFVMAADRDGRVFRFAPLGGETFQREVPADRAVELPDSFVIQRADGELLLRTDAVVHMLRRLGGFWRVPAALLAVIPRAWRDAAYDWIARHRLRFFRKPEAACPLVPPHLRVRFEP